MGRSRQKQDAKVGRELFALLRGQAKLLDGQLRAARIVELDKRPLDWAVRLADGRLKLDELLAYSSWVGKRM